MKHVVDFLAYGLSGLSLGRGAASELSTSAVSLVSHAHGRQRREERGIDKRQLQEAVKYGRKERANPGRDGKTRWRYTHKGIVYITDESSRHEITSWKLADALEEPPLPLGAGGGGGGGGSHVVVIVDHSGSMRKDDVPGYNSRTAAVYDCLARDLVEPQLRVGGVGKMEVSLIEMSDDATVVLERAAPNADLVSWLRGRMTARARSHGNYLPALDAALDLLAADAGRTAQLFVVLLSDGAPSDHTEMCCSHGYYVWQPDGYDPYNPQMQHRGRGKQRLQQCPESRGCRSLIHAKVQEDCVSRVKRLGDLLGRDRVFMGTVAFGPPDENYTVLQGMAQALPRSSFQKLGLSAACLRTAFTSLTSSLTTLRTEVAASAAGRGGGGSSPSLTLRADIAEKAERQSYEERDVIADGLVWELYCGPKFVRKRRYDARERKFVDAPFTSSDPVPAWEQKYPRMQKGIAHAMNAFGEGAERVVYQCTELVTFDGGVTGYCVGPRLVAKTSRYTQHLDDKEFHLDFCRTQGEAEELAQLFNRRLAGGPDWQVHFLPCFVYTIRDGMRYSKSGVLDILVEQELEGKFTKWNNNAGGVASGSLGVGARGKNDTQLGAIVEDDEDYDSEYGSEYDSEYGGGGVGHASGPASAEHVPQCFSHFTYCATDGKKLVCDLQGVWNPVDGFTLTDPAIHHNTPGRKRGGATDKGATGVQSFFATHVCNPLCRRLGLSCF
ncbi:hypothetical protein PLESTB_000663900 [Pleodorina starrii]|uniref:Alpha-type protein kinase domain-containing protein n=1 Tax=Pleodorina starrii TaxID=330485 RepID=A0A9W6BII6_9CHLO|nr:hypothetical protein PLESTM_001937900 [Pleodorina starrii]GLC52749.1 hypothetical protein PLESTB_000663900 [Pleodorina starrii]GLC65906.1 hypothetical protein PLESTF_000356700 [Pleodorina starrii]